MLFLSALGLLAGGFLFAPKGMLGLLTCHWSFIQPRPEPVADLRLSAWVEQSPGARNPHRV